MYLFLSLLHGSVAATVLNCFSRDRVSFSNSRLNPSYQSKLQIIVYYQSEMLEPSSSSQCRFATWFRKTSAGIATFCLPLSTSQSGRDIFPEKVIIMYNEYFIYLLIIIYNNYFLPKIEIFI